MDISSISPNTMRKSKKRHLVGRHNTRYDRIPRYLLIPLEIVVLTNTGQCHEYTFHRLCLPHVSRAGGSVAIEGTLMCPVVEELRVSNVVPVNTISSSMIPVMPTRQYKRECQLGNVFSEGTKL